MKLPLPEGDLWCIVWQTSVSGEAITWARPYDECGGAAFWPVYTGRVAATLLEHLMKVTVVAWF